MDIIDIIEQEEKVMKIRVGYEERIQKNTKRSHPNSFDVDKKLLYEAIRKKNIFSRYQHYIKEDQSLSMS